MDKSRTNRTVVATVNMVKWTAGGYMSWWINEDLIYLRLEYRADK